MPEEPEEERHIGVDFEDGEAPANWSDILLAYVESKGGIAISLPVLNKPRFCPIRGIMIQSAYVKVNSA